MLFVNRTKSLLPSRVHFVWKKTKRNTLEKPFFVSLKKNKLTKVKWKTPKEGSDALVLFWKKKRTDISQGHKNSYKKV